MDFRQKNVLLKRWEFGFGSVLELSLIHISEPTRPRLISYAVFCLKKRLEFRPGSAFFGISDLGFLPYGVPIKGVIEKGLIFDEKGFCLLYTSDAADE